MFSESSGGLFRVTQTSDSHFPLVLMWPGMERTDNASRPHPLRVTLAQRQGTQRSPTWNPVCSLSFTPRTCSRTRFLPTPRVH